MYNVENYDPAKMARACKRYVRISWKACVEIGKVIKGMKVDKARRLLQDVIEMKRSIPFTRFTEGAGHKTGAGPGRYPVNAAREILDLINSAVKNAEYQGLDSSRLYIKSFLVMKAPTFYRPRRSPLRGQKRKNVHISVVLEEGEGK